MMFVFKITMKHDAGKIDIEVTALTIAGAIQQVLAAERAPERAILNIKRVKELK
jgi:hypothetical protein